MYNLYIMTRRREERLGRFGGDPQQLRFGSGDWARRGWQGQKKGTWGQDAK